MFKTVLLVKETYFAHNYFRDKKN